MSKWVLAGLIFTTGTAWLALARPDDQGDDRRPPAAPVVKLNVVAVDARGQTVADLTREDFKVFDGGKLQHIASFRRNDIKPLRVAPPGPNEYSNRSGAPLSRATVILFDLLNARFDDRAYAVSRLVPALQHVEASDSLFLYILTIDGTLYPVHPLPDPETTTRTPAKPWTDEIKPLLDEAAHKLFLLRPLNLLVDDRVLMTYAALEALASRVAETPGRKSIIWISHGMPISIGGRAGAFDEIDYTPLLQRLTATLDRANVAVYPVRQPGSLAPGATARGATDSGASDTLGAGMASTETLEEFAGLTGGKAFHTVDIAGAIAQAASDARMSYLIAYDPPLEKWDGKYHKIRVECSRKGVRLQTKQGYYAFAAEAHEGDQEKAAIRTAISSPFDIPEIGLYASLAPADKTPRAMNLTIRIDAADVLLAREGELFTGQLAVAFAAYLADGRTADSPPGTFAVRLTPEEREKAVIQGISLVRLVTLPATVRKIRVMAYDRAAGTIGSLTVPVPDTTPKP
jgi:VWFA-related protein